MTTTTKKILKSFLVASTIFMGVLYSTPSESEYSSFTVKNPQPIIQDTSTIVPEIKNAMRVDLSREELKCLQYATYFEDAIDKSDDGVKAVTNLIINRKLHPKFPKNVCSVIRQRKHGAWQFSFYLNKRRHIDNDGTFERVQKLVDVALHAPDNTNGALYFHDAKLKKHWTNLLKIGRIGDNMYYKEPPQKSKKDI